MREHEPMNVAFYTLGCKVNQYETQALEQPDSRFDDIAAFAGVDDRFETYIAHSSLLEVIGLSQKEGGFG